MPSAIAMEPHELEKRIAEFPRWHYSFEFDGGVRTPVSDPGVVNRHEQRRRYFFEPLIRLTGGSLSGHRVLDLGCNAGFWSLHAVESGADFVLGVDARQIYIEQADLVLEAKGVDPARYRFERANIFEHHFSEDFDIVLCLGLLEHVAKPVELFELIAGVGAEIVVVDTEVTGARASVFHVEELYDHESVVDHPMVLVPSRQAVIELAHEFGFRAVPLAQDISDYSGMRDYRLRRRVAFVCSNAVALDGLPREKRNPMRPWWTTAAGGRP